MTYKPDRDDLLHNYVRALTQEGLEIAPKQLGILEQVVQGTFEFKDEYPPEGIHWGMMEEAFGENRRAYSRFARVMSYSRCDWETRRSKKNNELVDTDLVELYKEAKKCIGKVSFDGYYRPFKGVGEVTLLHVERYLRTRDLINDDAFEQLFKRKAEFRKRKEENSKQE